MNQFETPSPGQVRARTHFNTYGSGAAFDRKKQTYLSPDMQVFAECQDFCIVSFKDADGQVGGRLLHGRMGEFAKAPDDHHLIVRPLNRIIGPFVPPKAWGRARPQQASGASNGAWQLGLMFIEFKTRKRLCVHATGSWDEAEGCLALKVTESFFHCAKYIDPAQQILTLTPNHPTLFTGTAFTMPAKHEGLVHQLADFLAEQRLAFVCTVDRNRQCAVNHRGGKRGFIWVNVVRGETRVLLPDYTGNGAFEAIGNILETGRAALFVPDPERGYGVCISGPAELFDGEVLQTEAGLRLPGVQRVVAIYPLHCQVQFWNDDFCAEFVSPPSEQMTF